MPPEGGSRPPLGIAAATVQIGLGLLAVFLCAIAVEYLVDPFSLDGARALLATTCLGLGAVLFAVWMAGRTRRGWLLVLAAICGSLAVSMITITARLYARPRADDQTGIWMAIVCAALDVLCWIVITVAAIIEWRSFPGQGARAAGRRARFAAIVAPLALITAFVVVLVSAGPSWLIRLNSEVSGGEPAAEGRDPALTGDIGWTLELDAPGEAVALESGVAIPVPRGAEHSAGVIMVDPVNGRLRWRYELRGADGAPTLRPTDGGRGLVVDLGDVDDDVVRSTFTLDADSGQFRAVWPDRGEAADTDPPVLFDKEAQGTNSVIAISPTGRKLWTYRPERCADPRSVTSTHEVMLVRARHCDKGYPSLQIVGLDARTGEQRWVQDVPEDEEGKPEGGEDGPDQVVVGEGHQLELGGRNLARRALDTGTTDWKTPVAADCRDRILRRSEEVAFVGCGGTGSGDRAKVAAYATQTGEEQWQQAVDQPIIGMEAVDDQRVLALVNGTDSCALRTIDESGSRTVVTLAEGDQSDDPDPGTPICREAHLLRAGQSFVLQVRLVGDGPGSPERHRFIGLA